MADNTPKSDSIVCVVPSDSRSVGYTITWKADLRMLACDCPAFLYSDAAAKSCKHLRRLIDVTRAGRVRA